MSESMRDNLSRFSDSARDSAAPRRAVSLAARTRPQSRDQWGEDAAELNELAEAAGLDVLAAQTALVPRPKPATFIGDGRVAQLRELMSAVAAGTLVVGRDLSAAQTRNLERELNCRVVDRSTLILDIFARRARSFEGKLQVELARCRHEMSRLAGGWSHLERQRGGIGLRGGPGEKQIETDRRLLAGRIRKLEARMKSVSEQARRARRRREQNGALAVALVGYANAGKSSLFHKLTGGENGADKIFATLDSTARRAWFGDGAAVVSDTVGFIRDLPHALFQGFRATLEGAAAADLSLVVADCARPDWRERLAVVHGVLDEVAGLENNNGRRGGNRRRKGNGVGFDSGVDGTDSGTVGTVGIDSGVDGTEFGTVGIDSETSGADGMGGVGGSGRGRRLLVMNKIDRIGEKPRATRDDCGRIRQVWLSCKTGAGVPLLREALAQAVAEAANNRTSTRTEPNPGH